MQGSEAARNFEMDSGGWRERPAILAAIGAAAAVAVQQLVDRGGPYGWSATPIDMWRAALAIAITTLAGAIGFSLERVRAGWALGFAAIAGVAAGLIFYWNGEPGWGYFGDWRAASLFLAVAIAVPLFQTARDEGGWAFPYVEVHGHAWTNVVLWFACWAFAGVVFALAYLLSSLFDLIGLHFLRDLLRREWFSAALFGAAFGSALGLFRERDRVVRLLQRVVTAVLGVLAPVLGAGLLLFLASLPFTGLHTLWEATRATTPILLGCVAGALILANAVIGNGADEELGNRVLRWGALALAVTILPLATIAAVATGLRIAQYGLTPDRLWALTFVILASVYGVAYLAALARGRMDWAGWVRPANLRLAFVVAGIALFLATPILSFNALSTRDQVARLESGRTAPDKFDWAALAFDFGDAGKAAVKRLARSRDAAIATRARAALAKDNRYELAEIDRAARTVDALTKRLRVAPQPTPVPEGLRKLLTEWNGCGGDDKDGCTLLYTPGAAEAIALRDSCVDTLAKPQKGSGNDRSFVDVTCGPARYVLDRGAWRMVGGGEHAPLDTAQLSRVKGALAAGRIEVRPVRARQTFVGGVPVGEPFE